MGIEKNIKKLLTRPTEMTLEEVKGILFYFNFKLKNIHGSHFIFHKTGMGQLIIVSHQGKVKKWYLQKIKSKLILEFQNYLKKL